MAARIIEEIKQLRNANVADMNAPIIMKGIKGVDYILVEVVPDTTNTIAIGDLVSWETFPTDVILGADDAKIIGIVPDTVKNLKALARNNSGVALTKSLLFDAGYFEIALVIKSIIVEGKVITGALVEGENLMPATGGYFAPSDDTSSTCGVALHNGDAGTGTASGAVILCPAYGLATQA